MTLTRQTTKPGWTNSDGLRASGVGITLVQEMMEPELAGLRPKSVAGPLAQVRATLFHRYLED